MFLIRARTHSLIFHPSQPLVSSWLETLPEGVRERLQRHYDTFCAPLLRFLRREVREANPNSPGSLVTAWMRITSSLAGPHLTSEARVALGKDALLGLIDGISIFSLVWSICATACDTAGRELMSTFFRTLLSRDLSSYSSPSGHSYFSPDWEHFDLLAPCASWRGQRTVTNSQIHSPWSPPDGWPPP